MLDVVLVVFSIWWFSKTEYFVNWAEVKIGGEQISVSLTALIVIIYLAIGAFGAIRWYYYHKRC